MRRLILGLLTAAKGTVAVRAHDPAVQPAVEEFGSERNLRHAMGGLIRRGDSLGEGPVHRANPDRRRVDGVKREVSSGIAVGSDLVVQLCSGAKATHAPGSGGTREVGMCPAPVQAVTVNPFNRAAGLEGGGCEHSADVREVGRHTGGAVAMPRRPVVHTVQGVRARPAAEILCADRYVPYGVRERPVERLDFDRRVVQRRDPKSLK